MTSVRATFPLCVLLLLGACDSGPERSGELVVVFQAEDGRVTEGHQGEYFVGTTTVGETHEARVVVKNVGTASVDLNPITALGGAKTSVPGGEVTTGAVFEISSPEVPRLEPGAQTEMLLSFHPPREGRFIASFRVNTASVTLIGEGVRQTPITETPGLTLLPKSGMLVVLAPWFSSAPITTIRHVWFVNSGDTTREVLRASVEPLNDDSLESELEVGVGEDGIVLPASAKEHAKSVALRITPVSVGSKRWKVTFHTSDPETPELVLDLQVQAYAPTDCQIRVTPQHVTFGLVSPGERDVSVTVTNVGTSPTAPCLVTDVGFAPGSSDRFSLPQGELPTRLLGPGDSLSIPVRFSPPPNSEPHQAVLTIHTTSKATPQVEITFDSGTPPISCLVIAPQAHDFGKVSLGCSSAPRALNVYNTCTAPVVVTSVEIGHSTGGTGFEFVGPPNLPPSGVLASGQSPLFLQARYVPVDVGTDTGSVSVVAQLGDRLETHVVALRGVGEPARIQTDVFVAFQSNYRPGYYLSSTPDPSVGPIELTIDGQPVPAVSSSGQVVWLYDPLFNAIRFEPGLAPQGGQTIEVTYFTGCFS